MKKRIVRLLIPLVFALFVLGSSNVAFAQEQSLEQVQEQVQAQIQDLQENLGQVQVQNLQEDLGQIQGEIQQQIQEQAEALGESLGQVQDLQGQIQTKVEEQTDALQEQVQEQTVVLQENLDQIQEQVQEQIQDLQDNLEQALNSDCQPECGCDFECPSCPSCPPVSPCPPPVLPVHGCTDPSAMNYNPMATISDGSCQYPCPPPAPVVHGCTNPLATNFNSNAVVDDGSCVLPPPPPPARYTVSGMKFNDLDKDGQKDSNELGLENWTISLTGTGVQASVTTNEQGAYSFTDLLAGSYTVCETEKEGWTQSYPATLNGCHVLEVGSGSKTNIDFGNYQNPCPPPPVHGCTNPLATNFNPNAVVDDGSCVLPPPPPSPLVIKVFKVVCESESDLPNWSTTQAISSIDANTAANYVAQSNGRCHLESNWQFQWGFGDKNYGTLNFTEGVDKLPGDFLGIADGTVSTCFGDCGPNTKTGTSYNDWKNFGSATVEITDLQGSTSRIWVREVQKEGYVPLTNSNDNNVSAEIYCNNDILNYDNYSVITPPELGKTYYCIALNALKAVPPPPPVSGCTNPLATNYNSLATVDNGTCILPPPPAVHGCTNSSATNYNSLATVDDGSCVFLPPPISGCTDHAANNYNPLATVSNNSCTYTYGGGGGGGGGTPNHPVLKVQKSITESFVNPGKEASYTITVENIGFGEAKEVTVKDILPEGFKYVDNNITGTWSLGSIAVNEKKTINYKVLVPLGLKAGVYTNQIEVSAKNHNSVFAAADLEVKTGEVYGEEAIPVLTISIIPDRLIVYPGTFFNYEIEVKNIGQAPAVNVTIENIFPKGIVSQNDLSQVVWKVPLIRVGESWKITLPAYVTKSAVEKVYDDVAVAFAENNTDEVSAHAFVSVINGLPNTGFNLAGSNIFKLGLILAFLGLIGLAGLAIRRGRKKELFFGIILTISLFIFVYPFFPGVEYFFNQSGLSYGEEKQITEKVLAETRNLLIIPKIGVEIPIVEGNDSSALNKGAWLLPQSSLPDQKKNTALAAHRFKYKPPSKETFYLLDKLEKGDDLLVFWGGKEYRYQVVSSIVVDPSNTEILREGSEPLLTLITCTPLFTDKNRLIVQGRLIEVI
jgi:LPXTG-site transpeptidase (sortase) family protein